MNIEPPDSHHLRAAEGWLELGNWREADADIERISSEVRLLPEVLAMRFRIFSAGKDWERALAVGEILVALAPDNPGAWIDRSNALHYLGRYQEAFDHLQPAWEKFPTNPVIPYNFACFCCRMGRLDEARAWLDTAWALPGGQELKGQAGSDPDLEALRQADAGK
jgi:tetratricopeptide (TPR) repeat protein